MQLDRHRTTRRWRPFVRPCRAGRPVEREGRHSARLTTMSLQSNVACASAARGGGTEAARAAPNPTTAITKSSRSEARRPARGEARRTTHADGRARATAHEPPGEWSRVPDLGVSDGQHHARTYDQKLIFRTKNEKEPARKHAGGLFISRSLSCPVDQKRPPPSSRLARCRASMAI
jgi:hypothetical protein